MRPLANAPAVVLKIIPAMAVLALYKVEFCIIDTPVMMPWPLKVDVVGLARRGP